MESKNRWMNVWISGWHLNEVFVQNSLQTKRMFYEHFLIHFASPSVHPSNHPSIHSFIHLSNHSFIHSFTHLQNLKHDIKKKPTKKKNWHLIWQLWQKSTIKIIDFSAQPNYFFQLFVSMLFIVHNYN